MGSSVSDTQPSNADRGRLLALPLGSFLARVQDLDMEHDYTDLEERFAAEGLTPHLLPSMSDADLDAVLGPGKMGIRLFLRNLVGRQ
jgi:hypothetical protein